MREGVNSEMHVGTKLANQWLNVLRDVGCEGQTCASVAMSFSGELVSLVSQCTTMRFALMESTLY